MKPIKRTWTRKDGTVVVKYYERGKSRRGLTLVGKGGKINKKNLQKFKDEINKDTSLTTAEKQGFIADAEIMAKQRAKEGRKLTTTGFYGELQSSKISRLLANAGYSSEEAALELGVNEADILNAANWSGDVFSFGGKNWSVKFTYTGSLFTLI